MIRPGVAFKEGNCLKVCFKNDRKRDGKSLVSLDLRDFGITTNNSFLETAFRAQFNGTVGITAFYRSTVWRHRLPTLDAADQDFIKRVLAAPDTALMTRQNLVYFLSLLQDVVAARGITDRQIQQEVFGTRSLFAAGINALHAKGALDFCFRELEGFLPENGRAEAGDAPAAPALSNIEHPGGGSPKAIQNEDFGDDIGDAFQVVEAHLEDRLADLNHRCFAFYDQWATRRSRLLDLAAAFPDEQYREMQSHVDRVRRINVNNRTPYSGALVAAYGGEDLLAYYLREFVTEGLHRYANVRAKGALLIYPGGEACARHLSGNEKTNMLVALLNTLVYFDPVLLTALMAVILGEAAFNVGPLQRLLAQEVDREKGAAAQWHLKPLKSKTGKRQEAYLVKRAGAAGTGNRTGFDAMELLWANYQRLRSDWSFVPGFEHSVFSCIGHMHGHQAIRMPDPSLYFQTVKRQQALPAAYQLCNIRHQAGSLAAVRNKGDMRATQARLEHASLGASAHYTARVLGMIDQMVIRKYERQLEATLLFVVGGEDKVYAEGLQPRHVNLRLIPVVDFRGKPATLEGLERQLVPAGNGVGCADITDSPNHTIPEGELCDGQDCHACRNARYVMTEDRMRENILWLRYCRDNLEELRARNPEHWRRTGAPHLAFQIALAKVLSEHPAYGALYQRIQAEMAVDAADRQQEA